MADETKPPVPAPADKPAASAVTPAAPAVTPPVSVVTPGAPAVAPARAPAASAATPASPVAPAAPAAPRPPAPAAATHAAPPRPPAPAAPTVDLAGKTTTAAAAAAKVSSRDPDDTSPLVSRRAWLGLAWGSFTAASVAALAATGRFMFPNVLNEPPQQFKVGLPADYGMGVDERHKESDGVWIIRTNEDIVQHASGFYVLISTCTHLGCTPNYLSAENKFKCPCHGSGFRITGINFEGPAPRPLERARVVLAEDGQLLVDKSHHYQYELGQWIDPEAFLKL
ncbi:MAG TPA: Rieske 2Fe-2S domain-containing protein [Vicinamibacterales bacterium]|nr:Rieske 2Fe-2S domain-containing protein [Vicinamibacterales bacterium]